MQKLERFPELIFPFTGKAHDHIHSNGTMGHEKNGMMEGYTDNYIRITTPYRAEWANQVVDWKIQ